MISHFAIGLILTINLSQHTLKMDEKSHLLTTTILGVEGSLDTPLGIFFVDPKRVYKKRISWKYGRWLRWAMFFQDGYAIHETTNQPSHGCIHVPADASEWLWERVKLQLDHHRDVMVKIER